MPSINSCLLPDLWAEILFLVFEEPKEVFLQASFLIGMICIFHFLRFFASLVSSTKSLSSKYLLHEEDYFVTDHFLSPWILFFHSSRKFWEECYWKLFFHPLLGPCNLICSCVHDICCASWGSISITNTFAMGKLNILM